MLVVISQGKEKLTAFFDKIWKEIAEWFSKNKKFVSLVSETNLMAFVKANRINVALQDIQTVIKLTGGRKDVAEGILLYLKEIIEGKNILQLISKFGIKEVPLANSLSNY